VRGEDLDDLLPQALPIPASDGDAPSIVEPVGFGHALDMVVGRI